MKTLFQRWRIYDWLDIFPFRYRMWYYDNIKPIFKPCHVRLRKAIPRQWSDLVSIIENVNFEIIKSFYEEEYKNGHIDWSSSETHKAFEQWLIETYRYITVERPILKKRLENSYPPSRPFNEWFKPITDEKGRKMYELIDDGIPYEVKYKDVIHFEKTINKKDTKILTEMIKNREFFWT